VPEGARIAQAAAGRVDEQRLGEGESARAAFTGANSEARASARPQGVEHPRRASSAKGTMY
jgi:hypothetical protein